MRIPIALAIFLLLQACKHPLAIVGEGDIVDLNGSGYGCTLEQFKANAKACTENDVTGAYNVNYQARPRAGFQFVQWIGPCSADSVPPQCMINVRADRVAIWDQLFPVRRKARISSSAGVRQASRSINTSCQAP